jgi:hypothetical protein
MGFIERAFTPPGTGGQEAAAQQAAVQAQQLQPQTPAPTPPTMPTAPAPPPQFQPGAAPGATRRAQATASTMLGAAAAGGQTSRKTLLGQ